MTGENQLESRSFGCKYDLSTFGLDPLSNYSVKVAYYLPIVHYSVL